MILFDLPVYQFIVSFFSLHPKMITFMKLITTFGSTIVIVTGILCIAVLFKFKKPFPMFFFASLIGIILNSIVKLIVRRPRPDNTFPLSFENSFSFPSGHTFISTVFYGLIIYYTFKYLKNKKLKYIVISLLTLIIFLVGVSRIYLGVHYATDVLGGLIFGLVYLISFIKIVNKINSKKDL